ncbi:MAG: guanine deaminase [Burkholderiaceae bacterium]|nr:MAG: guanine deaminase [Burkholderiaceae bacterium]
MQAYRAQLLRFNAQGEAQYDSDGLLVVDGDPASGIQRVVDAGPYRAVAQRHPRVSVIHWPNRIVAPGFIDMHVHYPQTDIIGSPANGLLPWLEKYTFPAETRFCDPAYAAEVAGVFFDELLRQGVTTALTFTTTHPTSVDAFFNRAERYGLRMMGGKVLQDRNTPDGLRDETEQSLIDSEALLQRWHKKGRLGYAITPRFAPTSSEAQLRGAGELAARYPDTWIHSHLSENRDEVRWVSELFPATRSYLDVYQKFGLLRERAVYAHCIHLDDADRRVMHETHAAAAVCPTSNLFLGSGFFDHESADRFGVRYGLGSDVGGGTSFSPFRTMLATYFVGRECRDKKGVSIAPSALWWSHTGGAARALGLDGVIGTLQAGTEADFVVLNPKATPLLARKVERAQNLEEMLFAIIVLGDDRVIERVVIA